MNSTNTNNPYLGVGSNNEPCAKVLAYGKCISITDTPSTPAQKAPIIIVAILLLMGIFGLAIIVQSVRRYRAQRQKSLDEESRIADEERMSRTIETFWTENGIHYPDKTAGK
ncbi:hypothetical protein EAF04_001412 [Stromatinia cepivora]|nr:hypothetical protein EAF04_001412 [Stromatinia cepivora]